MVSDNGSAVSGLGFAGIDNITDADAFSSMLKVEASMVSSVGAFISASLPLQGLWNMVLVCI